jgi:uncharacterized protein (TIGR02246 family)
MSQHLRLLESLLLLVPLLGFALAASPGEEDDVRKVVGGIPEAWNRHDMEAFGRLFAVDADFVNVAGDWWKGRNAIQTNHAYTHGTIPAEAEGVNLPRPAHGIFKDTTLQITRLDVRFLRDDVALAHASTELLGDPRAPSPRRTLLTLVLVRQSGGWLIASAQNTEIGRPVKRAE